MRRTVHAAPASRRAATGLSFIAILSCGESPTTVPPPPPPTPRPATLSVRPPTAELTAFGDTVQLAAEVRDQNGQIMSGVSVTWASSSIGVATVGVSGLVTAVADGVATITATAGSASGNASVTVAQQVAEVVVSPAADTLVERETRQLEAEARDANGHAVAEVGFMWASSDASVVSVDSTGLATAVAAGEALVTAASAAEVGFMWASSDASVVSVDSTGLATAVAAGEALVTAASAAVTGSATLRVVAPEPATVEVMPDTAKLMALRDTVRLAAEVRDQIGRLMPGVPVTWSSDDESVVTVDSAGLVRAEGPGATSVSATAGTASGNSAVSVMQSAGSVVVLPPADTLAAGDTLRLSAEAFDDNGYPITGTTFAWRSSDASVARVDEAGLVEGIAEGAATITATAGIVSGRSEIVVISPDRAALVAFYASTGGDGWTHARNWLTDAPLRLWDGVRVEGGRVLDLVLPRNNLTGTLPAEIGRLSKLEGLTLWGNNLTGALPAELGDLANLTVLNMGATGLQGSIPPELGKLSNLERLELGINGLTGRIPPELGNLAKLKKLQLGGNRLTGPLPSELGNLASLTEANLWWNDLAGPIPPTLGDLKNLKVLVLAENRLSGPLPPELGELSSLERLSVRQNELVGPIPRSFLKLASQLESFDFSYNPRLCVPGTTGFVEWLKQGIDWFYYCHRSDLAVLASLHEATGGTAWTRSDSWLGSAATSEWYGVQADSLGRVQTLDLRRNGLRGQLPRTLGELAELTALRLGGNALTGQLPRSLARLALRELNYAETSLCEPRDTAFREWLTAVPSREGTNRACPRQSDRNILELLYEATDGPNWTRPNNWLTNAPLGDWYGIDTDAQGRVTHIDLGSNDLTGSIPLELGDLSELRVLSLRANNLSGPIPLELGRLSNLRSVDLFLTRLTGPDPPGAG
ncbi:Ig-like domain-containing protein [Candidatus Palauibacter sp.]|uniref:Ig-like domain-containing protein n=1 Tax=Candidatus Palauibacter sp. TaxID=3101350 RepID=UPI003CC6BAA9